MPDRSVPFRASLAAPRSSLGAAVRAVLEALARAAGPRRAPQPVPVRVRPEDRLRGRGRG